MFKKGDKVTIIASWDAAGSVYVRHYVVSSWGKKQATLIRVDDLSNAKFRWYTDEGTMARVQGIHSKRIIPTADYSDAVALQVAQEFIDSENVRAEERWARAQELYSNPAYVPYPYAGTRAQSLAFERKVYDDHKAVAWRAAIK